MKNILVTGGAGYIGSHCCKELFQKGYHPVTVDNLVYGHRKNVKWGDFFQGHIGDRKVVEKVFGKYDIEAVMHFAAYAYVGESVTDPRKYYHNNLCGTIDLLHCMLDCGINKIIFSSTCATYGLPQRIPIDETHSRKPISPYGKSKFMTEEILKDYDKAYGMRFISLRYFNAAGADSDGEIGEEHNPETHLIPLVLAVAGGHSKNLRVFGSDYETQDGSCIRDYIHVTDLARAHILALENLLDGGSSDFINLGTGKGSSVLEIIDIASRVTGRKIPYVAAARRPGDPAVLIASNTKAGQILGWQPEYTGIEDIIRTAWNWHKNL